MDQQQFRELWRAITGGALLIGGAILLFAWPWVGGVIAFAGLWTMLFEPLKRWWKSDQVQTWWETGKTGNASGETPEGEKKDQ